MADVSVIVTSYNLEQYIGSCLDSILSQTGVDFEIICVDDASIDGTKNILEEYEKRDSRVKVVRQPCNKGLASARNEGYRHAKGEYLYSIDGDDLLADGALRRMYRCAKENDLDLLGFSARCFFDDESMRQFGMEDEYVRSHEYPGVYEGPKLFALLLENGDRATCNRVLYCYNRSFFLENNLFDEEGLRYADDSMFSFYVTAKRAMCISEQWYLRRYRPGSVVTSPLKKRYLESMVVLFCSEMKRWRGMEFTDEVNRQIEVYFDRRLSEIYQMQKMFAKETIEERYLKEHPADCYFYRRFIMMEPIYKDCFSAAQLSCIKQAETVILYGAGYMAAEVAKVLEYHTVSGYQVVVTKARESGEMFRGKCVKSICELSEMKNALIIVAMDSKHKKDVMSVLESYGFQNIMWISL